VACSTHTGRKKCAISLFDDDVGKECMESVGIDGKNNVKTNLDA
jgi:hypothetical protein